MVPIAGKRHGSEPARSARFYAKSTIMKSPGMNRLPQEDGASPGVPR